MPEATSNAGLAAVPAFKPRAPRRRAAPPTWCTTARHVHESLVYPAAAQPLDRDEVHGESLASRVLGQTLARQLDEGVSVPVFNALLHGGTPSTAVDEDFRERYPHLYRLQVPGALPATAPAHGAERAAVFSARETRPLLTLRTTDGDDEAAGRRAILWADESETLHGEMEHFALRRERIRSARDEPTLMVESCDLFLEQLRRQERAILLRKRAAELERIRGPAPAWYERRDVSFSDELQRNTRMLRHPEHWRQHMVYATQLVGTSLD